MKIGLSTYALHQAVSTQRLTVLDAIQWIADNGGDQIEIASGFLVNLEEQPELIELIRQKSIDVGLPISHYCVGANFSNKTESEWAREVERVKRHVDICQQLGIKKMRHDVANRPIEQCGVKYFEQDLPRMVKAAQQIADYAAEYGITTSIENHGYFMASSERVLRVIHLVDRTNFKMTIDIGNFLIAGEDPLSAVKKCLRAASMIHLKDNLLRDRSANPGEGFRPLPNGNYYRSTILGHGDMNVRAIIQAIKQSNYDGLFSLEFGGIEDCLLASRIGMANAKRFWNEV